MSVDGDSDDEDYEDLLGDVQRLAMEGGAAEGDGGSKVCPAPTQGGDEMVGGGSKVCPALEETDGGSKVCPASVEEPVGGSKVCPTSEDVAVGGGKVCPASTQVGAADITPVKSVSTQTDPVEEYVSVPKSFLLDLQLRVSKMEAEIARMQKPQIDWSDPAALKKRMVRIQAKGEQKGEGRKKRGTNPSVPLPETLMKKFYNFRSKQVHKHLDLSYVKPRLRGYGIPNKYLDSNICVLEMVYLAINFIQYKSGLTRGIDKELPSDCRKMDVTQNKAFEYLCKVNPNLGSYLKLNGGLKFFTSGIGSTSMADINYHFTKRTKFHLMHDLRSGLKKSESSRSLHVGCQKI